MPDLSRQLLLYNGYDQVPINDYTTDSDWQQTEFGANATNGDGAESTWVVDVPEGDIPDKRGATGTKYISPHNRLKLFVGSNTIWRGRVAGQNFERGPTRGTYPQEFRVTASDPNSELQGMIVHYWARPAETDVARVQGLAASYLSGSPRPSTVLNGSNFVITGSNTVAMPAKTYFGVTPAEILQELARQSDKDMFVDVDDNLHYHGHDYTGFDSPLRISDDPADLNSTTLLPIEPKANEDSLDQITVLRSYYGADEVNRSVQVTDNTHLLTTDYWEDVVYDDESATTAQAIIAARQMLSPRRLDQITYTVRVGLPGVLQDGNGHPMRGDFCYMLKAGMRIQFKSRAVRGGIANNGSRIGDVFQTCHIREVRWTYPGPDQYYADLTLERPVRPYRGRSQPKATSPKPPTTNNTVCRLLSTAEMTSIAVTNGDAEDTGGGQWTGGAYATSHEHGGSRSYGSASAGTATITYTFPAAQVFKGGTRYVADIWREIEIDHDRTAVKLGVSGGDEAIDNYIGVVGTDPTDLFLTNETGADGHTWNRARVCWTPSADRTGVRFQIVSTSFSAGYHYFDDLTLFSVDEDNPAPLGDAADPGDSSSFASGNHVHSHGDRSSNAATMHQAASVTFTPTGTVAATNVQAAIAEVAAEAGSATMTVQEGDVTVDAAVTILDFGNGLDVTSSPAGEANIVVDPSELKLDDLGAPDDNTDRDASTSSHGLLPKLGGGTTNFLRADGAWADPAVGDIGDMTMVVKTADEVVNNSTTLQDDNHLLLSLAVSEAWRFELNIWWDASTAGDIKFAFTVPTGCTLNWSQMGTQADGSTAQEGAVITVSGTSNSHAGQGVGTTRHSRIEGFVENGANTGNLQLQWAHASASATDVTVHKWSTLQAWLLN